MAEKNLDRTIQNMHEEILRIQPKDKSVDSLEKLTEEYSQFTEKTLLEHKDFLDTSASKAYHTFKSQIGETDLKPDHIHKPAREHVDHIRSNLATAVKGFLKDQGHDFSKVYERHGDDIKEAEKEILRTYDRLTFADQVEEGGLSKMVEGLETSKKKTREVYETIKKEFLSVPERIYQVKEMQAFGQLFSSWDHEEVRNYIHDKHKFKVEDAGTFGKLQSKQLYDIHSAIQKGGLDHKEQKKYGIKILPPQE